MVVKCNDTNCKHNINHICNSSDEIDISFDYNGQCGADVNCSYNKVELND